ncbi:MAG: ATP-binding protein [Campylobacterota bacterium]|nr:ATP-binding protein [Campylobacterota bacterium]
MNNQINLMEINSPNIGKMDDSVEFQTLYINNLVGEHIKSNKLNIRTHELINMNTKDFKRVFKILESKFDLYQIHNKRVLIMKEDLLAELWWVYDSSFTGFNLSLLSSSIQNSQKGFNLIKETLKEFLIDDTPTEYTLMQYDNGNIRETNYQDIIEVDFNTLAVPFVEDSDKYIEDYLNSNSSILILNGEPGTGKTTFTKYVLSKLNEKVIKKDNICNVLYSFDENIFYAQEFFHQIVYKDFDVIVLEDFNQVIHKNSDEQGGLNPLHKLLSLTDGILNKNKKIIITTNIDSKSQIHPALTRPGRCFDVLNFRNLHGVEIDNLCDSYDKDLDLQIESINLSEFFARCDGEQNTKMANNKLGF